MVKHIEYLVSAQNSLKTRCFLCKTD